MSRYEFKTASRTNSPITRERETVISSLKAAPTRITSRPALATIPVKETMTQSCQSRFFRRESGRFRRAVRSLCFSMDGSCTG